MSQIELVNFSKKESISEATIELKDIDEKENKNGYENPAFINDEEKNTYTPAQKKKLDLRRKTIQVNIDDETNFHKVSLEELYKRYGTSQKFGLTDGQLKENLELFGKNVLTPPKTTPVWIKFIKTLMGGFQLLLWTGSLLSFTAYLTQSTLMDNPPEDNLYLGCVLSAVVLVLGLFTFYQEYSSGKIMDSFLEMIPSFASVLRNGRFETINASELTLGDIVEVKGGNTIPADIRIISCQGLKVDNSSLTGESEPQSRSTECTDLNIMETKNIAFYSTNALEGSATGIVIAVGDETLIGKIAGLVTGVEGIDTPMARELAYFVKLISGFAVLVGFIFFGLSLMMGYNWLDACIFIIGIIVANVPEGLLVTFTVILALTAKKMANKNCLVKQLHAVETLGSTTVICSDKTGTLTQNIMTVSHFYFNDTISTSSKANDFKTEQSFISLARVASLCLKAKFNPDQENIPVAQRKMDGDASEKAILKSMEEILGKIADFQMRNPKVFEIPFNSSNKYQVSIHMLENEKEMRYYLVMKGAPEIIMKYCKKYIVKDKESEIENPTLDRFNQVCEEIANMGERIIGFCDVLLPIDQFPPGYNFDGDEACSFLNVGLRFVGLMSMIDPPRGSVPDAVRTCREAGIKVVMVTGDHPITAKAISRSVGIISKENETAEEVAKRLNVPIETIDRSKITAAIVTGSQLSDLNSDELDHILKNNKEIVFARVSPQQKLIIVEAFQRLNHVVAVTGDGVNDSPALKRADIGIAMGITGSDVSKQAADMILMDDNFTSIVSGVEEGRLIFDNLKKCICYLLAANIAELTPFLIFIILRIPLALGTIPMLMICLGTDIVPTISLSYEKAEGDIMKRPPRDPVKDHLVTGRLIFYSYGFLGIIQSFAGFFAFFYVAGQNGFLPGKLVGIAPLWDSMSVNELEDSYGQEWTFFQRKQLEHTCWTAYFVAVVVCQFGNVLVSKTRRGSLFGNFFSNPAIFYAILFEILLSLFLIYTPYLNEDISYMPLKFEYWTLAIPFCIFLMIFDETRKFIIRSGKSLWFTKEFYY